MLGVATDHVVNSGLSKEVIRLTDEPDDLDPGLTEETPPRPSRSRRVWPYALLAITLAHACAYLVWERYENAAAVGRLQKQVQGQESKQTELADTMTEVGDALVELSEHSASEAELHHGLGNRTQALADLDRARHLLDLAQDLGKCLCAGKPAKRVNNKLKGLVALLGPTEEELPGLTLESDRPKPGNQQTPKQSGRRKPRTRQTPKQDIEPNSTRSGSPPPAER